MMKKHNLAFIDIETTGLDVHRHEIIEIGLVVARQIPQEGRGPRIEVVDEVEVKVRPERIEDAQPKALEINGYTPEAWKDALSLTEALKVIASKTKKAIIVGHNFAFDWAFLNEGFLKTGVRHEMHYHRLDTLPMAFAKLYHEPAVQAFSLSSLATYFGVVNEDPHTALADVRTTVAIYEKLLDIA